MKLIIAPVICSLVSTAALAAPPENLPWGYYKGTHQMTATGHPSISGDAAIGIFPRFIVFTFCGDGSCSLREFEYRLDQNNKVACLSSGQVIGKGTWKNGVLEFDCVVSKKPGKSLKDHIKITRNDSELTFSHVSTLNGGGSDSESGHVSLIALSLK